MAKLGGSKSRKREVLPPFYITSRKKYTFSTNLRAGAHKKSYAFDPITVLRDILKLGKNLQEIKKAMSAGALLVNGRVVKEYQAPLGLMDVLNINGSETYYRLLPINGKALYPVSIDKAESEFRIGRIVKKTSIGNEKYQYTCHDGSNFISESKDYRPGDSLLISNVEGKIVQAFPLAKGNYAIIFKGRRVGVVGKIVEILPSTLTRKGTVKLSVSNTMVTVPSDYVMVIGKERPAIKVSSGELP
ncbi:MAG: hypothetical protein QXY52_06030 [Conexivisphaerales archaeon]